MRGGEKDDMSSSCVRGGTPRPIGGYQTNLMLEPSSPTSAWQYNTVLIKQEPADHEERNDSGISGSDFHSSSPGSDHSENIPYPSPIMALNQPPQTGFYMRANQGGPIFPQPTHFYQSPSTSLSSELMASPNSRQTPNSGNTTLTPRASPAEGTTFQQSSSPAGNDPLKRLQMSLENTGLLPSPVSPKLSEYSGSDEAKSENDPEEYNKRRLRVPKVNSHGKVKTFKCKQCTFVAITKLDFWEHTRTHIKADKLLTCSKCPFVTEYKHHLEYHLRNHVGSKPFKCDQCNYSCVNKSMLNSHLKSHSNVYQYNCSDCTYATKYCHSLKIHLRKYKHTPAMVLNPDGTPNPLPIIDVYGTRRGPKVKSQERKKVEEDSPVPEPRPEQMLPFPLNQFILNSAQIPLPFAGFPFFGGFPGAIPNPLVLRHLQNLIREQGGMPPQDNVEDTSSETMQTDAEALDLSKQEEPTQKDPLKSSTTPTDDAFSDEEEITTMFSNVEVVEEKEAVKMEDAEEEALNNNKDDYNCPYCKIKFGEPVLYTMHMGYHGYKNPFACNMCGEVCKDEISFFLHIARTPHS